MINILLFVLIFLCSPVMALAPASSMSQLTLEQHLQDKPDVLVFDVDQTLSYSKDHQKRTGELIPSPVIKKILWLLSTEHTVVLASARSPLYETLDPANDRISLYDYFASIVQLFIADPSYSFSLEKKQQMLRRLFLAPENGAYLICTADLTEMSHEAIVLQPREKIWDETLHNQGHVHLQNQFMDRRFTTEKLLTLSVQQKLEQDLLEHHKTQIKKITKKPSGYAFTCSFADTTTNPETTKIKHDILKFLKLQGFELDTHYSIFEDQKDGKIRSFLLHITGLDKKLIVDMFQNQRIMAFGDQGQPQGNDHDLLEQANVGFSVDAHDPKGHQIYACPFVGNLKNWEATNAVLNRYIIEQSLHDLDTQMDMSFWEQRIQEFYNFAEDKSDKANYITGSLTMSWPYQKPRIVFFAFPKKFLLASDAKQQQWIKILSAFINNRTAILGPSKWEVTLHNNEGLFLKALQDYYQQTYKSIEEYRHSVWGTEYTCTFTCGDKPRPALQRQTSSHYFLQASPSDNTHPSKKSSSSSLSSSFPYRTLSPDAAPMSSINRRYYVGLDIGGTSMKIVIVDQYGKLQHINHDSYILDTSSVQSIDLIPRIIAFINQCPPTYLDHLDGIGIAWLGNRSSHNPLEAMLQTDALLVYQRESLAQQKPELIEQLRYVPYVLSKNFHVPVQLLADSEARALRVCANSPTEISSTYFLRFGTSVGGFYIHKNICDNSFPAASRIVINLAPDAPKHSATNVKGMWQPYAASYGFEKFLIEALRSHQNISTEPITRHNAGKIVHEFFASSDFQKQAVAQEVIAQLSHYLAEAIINFSYIYNPLTCVSLEGTSLSGSLGKRIEKATQELLTKKGALVTVVLSEATFAPLNVPQQAWVAEGSASMIRYERQKQLTQPFLVSGKLNELGAATIAIHNNILLKYPSLKKAIEQLPKNINVQFYQKLQELGALKTISAIFLDQQPSSSDPTVPVFIINDQQLSIPDFAKPFHLQELPLQAMILMALTIDDQDKWPDFWGGYNGPSGIQHVIQEPGSPHCYSFILTAPFTPPLIDESTRLLTKAA